MQYCMCFVFAWTRKSNFSTWFFFSRLFPIVDGWVLSYLFPSPPLPGSFGYGDRWYVYPSILYFFPYSWDVVSNWIVDSEFGQDFLSSPDQILNAAAFSYIIVYKILFFKFCVCLQSSYLYLSMLSCHLKTLNSAYFKCFVFNIPCNMCNAQLKLYLWVEIKQERKIPTNELIKKCS